MADIDESLKPLHPPNLDVVTPRQIEMLDLVSRGLSSAEAGRRVFVSPDTVKTHLRRLFRALGARNRTQAVRIAFEHGLLQLDRPEPDTEADTAVQSDTAE